MRFSFSHTFALLRLQLPASALNPAFDAKSEPIPEEDVEGEVVYTLLKAFANEKHNQKGQNVCRGWADVSEPC